MNFFYSFLEFNERSSDSYIGRDDFFSGKVAKFSITKEVHSYL